MATLSTTYFLTIETTNCVSCGTVIALEQQFYRDRRDDHRSFYCPNGHSQHFSGKSEEQKLRERLEAEQRQRIQERNRLESRLESEQRSHAATKGQLTKTKKRAHAALCPAEGCGRSFVQLQRHLKSKHPELSS